MVITANKQVFEFYVAGVQHHSIKDVLDELSDGLELQMIPEPTNQYDATAVQIIFNSIEQNGDVMLGYVPGKLSADVTKFLKKSILPICEISMLTPEAKPWQQLKVKIYDEGEI
jgi:hypothetical protein